MILAGTGHRPPRLGNEWEMDGPISHSIRKQIQKIFEIENPTKIISGAALGFDFMLYEEAMKANIPILLAIPHKGHAKNWIGENKQKWLQAILNLDIERIYISEEYSRSCFWTRDKYMVDNCDKVIACFDNKEKSGGTWITMEYANKTNKPILYIEV